MKVKHKWIVVLLVCLSLGSMCFAATTHGKISSISYENQQFNYVPPGWWVYFIPTDNPNKHIAFVTQTNVTASGWSTGDYVTVIDPDSSHPCSGEYEDSVLINITRGRWVCAVQSQY